MRRAAIIDETGHHYFPAWQRWLDPLLLDAERNHLYIAFRERRERLRSRTFPGERLRITVLAGLVGAVLLLGMLKSAWWFPLLPFIPATARFLKHFFRQRHRRLPASLGEVMLPVVHHRQAAEDVWMMGYTGRDVAEAIYLESQENLRGRIIVPVYIVSLILLTGGLVAHRAHPFEVLALSAAWLLLTSRMSRYLAVCRMFHHAVTLTRMRLAAWHKGRPVKAWMRHVLPPGIIFWVPALLWMLLVTSLLVIMDLDVGNYMFSALTLVLTALILHLRTLAISQSLVGGFDEATADANAAFETMMHRVASEEPVA